MQHPTPMRESSIKPSGLSLRNATYFVVGGLIGFFFSLAKDYLVNVRIEELNALRASSKRESVLAAKTSELAIMRVEGLLDSERNTTASLLQLLGACNADRAALSADSAALSARCDAAQTLCDAEKALCATECASEKTALSAEMKVFVERYDKHVVDLETCLKDSRLKVAAARECPDRFVIPHIADGLFLDNRLRKGWPDYGPVHAGRKGLEVGGPSDTLRDMNIYDAASSLDNVNFASKTVFTDRTMTDAGDFTDTTGVVRGKQYIREASDLKFPTDSYDFIVSSHALEHAANPLMCFVEWSRVVKPGGTLLMLLPWGPGTFDKNRVLISMPHLLDDFYKRVGEDDLTHVEEIIRDHLNGTGLGPKTKEEFEERSRANPINRGMHQHVFDLGTLVQMAEWAGFSVINTELFQDINLLIYAVNRK